MRPCGGGCVRSRRCVAECGAESWRDVSADAGPAVADATGRPCGGECCRGVVERITLPTTPLRHPQWCRRCVAGAAARFVVIFSPNRMLLHASQPKSWLHHSIAPTPNSPQYTRVRLQNQAKKLIMPQVPTILYPLP